MNLLHINASDTRWGASIAGHRFHKALLRKEYGSHILCGLKESMGSDTTAIVPGPYGYIPNALVGKSFNLLGLQSFGYPSSFFIKFSKWIDDWADVAVLRNLHWWYFSIGVLPWIAKRVPLIWRLTDMWPLTGHCVYSYDCDRWRSECGECPHLSDYPKLLFDTTHFLWRRKNKIYQELKDRLVFVSPSKWLMAMVGESSLTRDFRCEYIPTAVDLEVFKPGLREESRLALGIAGDEKVIMFSSFKLNDKRKGLADFLEAIKSLKDKVSFPLTILLTGCRGEEIPFPSGVKVVRINFTNEDKFLTLCYNACDVYLLLSRADNLPNALVEASACGTPVITLDNGGCPEALNNKKSGYVVEDSKEAIEALKDILSNEAKQKEFSQNARKFAENKFSMDSQVESYVGLAQELIKK